MAATVKCNRLDKTPNSFNCYLTPTQAVELAHKLLEHAHKLMKERRDSDVVTLWNVGAGSKRIGFGFDKATKEQRG